MSVLCPKTSKKILAQKTRRACMHQHSSITNIMCPPSHTYARRSSRHMCWSPHRTRTTPAVDVERTETAYGSLAARSVGVGAAPTVRVCDEHRVQGNGDLLESSLKSRQWIMQGDPCPVPCTSACCWFPGDGDSSFCTKCKGNF